MSLRPLVVFALSTRAVVTGCTGGLGQEFANRCAARGLNLVLISRSQSKLNNLSVELKKNYGVEVVVLAFDFARSSPEAEAAFYGKVLPEFIAASPVEGNVGLLINNVGVGDEAPFAVEEIKIEDVADMVKVNCGAIVNMSRAMLPLFKHRKGGAVINVSSGSCAQPSPYLATYASTKAFDLHFSKSCSREMKPHGVAVLGIRPYYIAGTGLYPSTKPALNAPAARTIVEGAFAHLVSRRFKIATCFCRARRPGHAGGVRFPCVCSCLPVRALPVPGVRGLFSIIGFSFFCLSLRHSGEVRDKPRVLDARGARLPLWHAVRGSDLQRCGGAARQAGQGQRHHDPDPDQGPGAQPGQARGHVEASGRGDGGAP